MIYFNKICIALIALITIMQAAFSEGKIHKEVQYKTEKMWHNRIEVLRIGIMTGHDIHTVKTRIEPFRSYLETMLHMPVEIIPYRNWDTLILAQANALIDYSLPSAGAYAGIWTMCQCVEPLVVGQFTDGAIGYYSVLVMRNDTNFNSLKDLYGKKILFTHEGSTAGYLLPFAELHLSGVDFNIEVSHYAFSGTAQKGVEAVITGKANAVFTWSSLTGMRKIGYNRGALTYLVKRKKLDMSMIKIPWQSQLIPNPPHIVRSSLPGSLKDRLQAILLNLSKTNPSAFYAVDRIGAAQFTPITHDAFRPLIEIAKGKQYMAQHKRK